MSKSRKGNTAYVGSFKSTDSLSHCEGCPGRGHFENHAGAVKGLKRGGFLGSGAGTVGLVPWH